MLIRPHREPFTAALSPLATNAAWWSLWMNSERSTAQLIHRALPENEHQSRIWRFSNLSNHLRAKMRRQCCLNHFAVSLCFLFFCVGFTIWCVYAACSHSPPSSWLFATSLLRYTWMWAIIQRGQDVCGSRITFWHKIGLNEISYLPLLWYRTSHRLPSVSSSCSGRASEVCSSLCLFLCISRARKHKYTPVFAKGARERGRGR